MCCKNKMDTQCMIDVNLRNTFTEAAKKATGDGQSMTQQTLVDWLTKAKVIDGQSITKEEFASAFQKLGKTDIDFSEFTKLLVDLASSKNLDVGVLKKKLTK
ncbi:uncharacterized protein LOC128990526 [Macrosteles quadrilineatus]|uniref:uncharacterized protein LOC128990526 n=1 Tax=Macrosteles quadrilineatus TaxID=74068 RepID=UPI0023E34EC2|nr:uncharacterized protein LOC128990526 [Macrosteles quadrilineatus]